MKIKSSRPGPLTAEETVLLAAQARRVAWESFQMARRSVADVQDVRQRAAETRARLTAGPEAR